MMKCLLAVYINVCLVNLLLNDPSGVLVLPNANSIAGAQPGHSIRQRRHRYEDLPRCESAEIYLRLWFCWASVHVFVSHVVLWVAKGCC